MSELGDLIIGGLEEAIDYVRASEIKGDKEEVLQPIRVLNQVAQYLSSEFVGESSKWENFRINSHLISKYSSLFSSKFMATGPISQVNVKPKITVTVRSHALQYRKSIEEIMDLEFAAGTSKDDLKDFTYSRVMMDEVADEMASHIRRIQEQGLIYCPYIPLLMIRCVDQYNFQPLIGFKTRFAVFPEEVLDEKNEFYKSGYQDQGSSSDRIKAALQV